MGLIIITFILHVEKNDGVLRAAKLQMVGK